MIRRIRRAALVALAAALTLPFAGCGPGGSVYVGVSAPGPWVGYGPGYVGRPPYYGYPGRRYEEDDAPDPQAQAVPAEEAEANQGTESSPG